MSDRSQTTICKSISPVLKPENANIRLRMSAGSGTRGTADMDLKYRNDLYGEFCRPVHQCTGSKANKIPPKEKTQCHSDEIDDSATKVPSVLTAEFCAAVFACEGTKVTMVGTMLKTSRTEKRRYWGSTIVKTTINPMAVIADAIAAWARRL